MSRALFYNIAPGRPAATVNRELAALCHVYRPRVFGVVEAVGYLLPPIPGYALLRDRSRRSRANVAAYVRLDCELGRWRFLDMHETWSRTEHPGQHEPRSFLRANVGNLQLLVAHQPPQGTDNTTKAQLEQLDALARIMHPWTVQTPDPTRGLMVRRPRLLLWDPNTGTAPNGPEYLAHRIGGQAHGFHTDGAVSRGVVVGSCEYVHQAEGIQLGTDHPGALLLELEARGIQWRLPA